MLFILEKELLNNTVYAWLIAIAATLFTLVLLLLVKKLLARRLARKDVEKRSSLDIFLGGVLVRTRFIFLLVFALFIGSLFLNLPLTVHRFLETVMIVVLMLQIGIWGTGIIDFWINRRIREEMLKDNTTATTLNGLGLVVRIVFWCIIMLVILDSIPGLEVSTLVASLGITGIAVALAVQNILGDLFASLSITLDKPFVIGDFIRVDDKAGSVEYIGLKSTRVRSLSGEQLVFSNSDLLSSRISNFKRMERRRIAFTVGVTYQTSPEKLEAMPEMIRGTICDHPQTTFDRAHFKEFSDSGLIFEVVYFVESPDYMVYMDIQQTINLAIFRRFADEGISFAYPTQTLFVENSHPAQV